MRIVYMGTPDFAVAPLRALHAAGHEIALVVSQPDRPKGRGKKLQPTPVKEAAQKLGLPVFQPEKIKKDPELLERMRALAPDLAVVAAYGKILPKEILEAPRLGCVNIHGSLLPKYRGSAPVQRAILNGDPVTGITLMHMAEAMDAGDMIAKAETETAGKTAGELMDELSRLGAALLIETLPAIEAGTAPRVPQDESAVTLAPMIEKAEGHLDFSRGAAALECQIRAFQPWPGAFADYEGETMKIHSAQVLAEGCGAAPGTVLAASPAGIRVATGDGILLVTGIQAPGKKAMPVSEFLKGHAVAAGSVFR